VGSAGVMLPHYSALKVAEQFRVLEAIAPGRIDLGLGRAPGSDGLTAYALNPNAAKAADMFPAQVRDLMAWSAGGELGDKHPFRDVRAQPTGESAPEIWILGSSDYGAQVAAHFGLPYCFAHFITSGRGTEEALDVYRSTYRPSARHPEPYAALCVWAVAGDTEAAAERLFASRALWRLGRDKGVFAPLPSPEEAATYRYSDIERAKMERDRARAIYGTGPEVTRRLRELGASLGVDEMAVLSTVHDPVARRHSYTLLAEGFGLRASDPARMAAE